MRLPEQDHYPLWATSKHILMKNIKRILAILFVLISACTRIEKPDDNQTVGEEIPRIDSTAPVPLKPRPPLVLDTSVERKVAKAFKLLQKYAKKSRVLPQETAKMIGRYNRVIFGQAWQIEEGKVQTQLDDTPRARDLVVFFTDTIFSDKEECIGKTLTIKVNGGSIPILLLETKYGKKSSIALIGSLLLHELTHAQFVEQHFLQGKSNSAKNELVAFSRQACFLVYAYNGPAIEYKWHTSTTEILINIPPADQADFKYYLRKTDELNRIVKK